MKLNLKKSKKTKNKMADFFDDEELLLLLLRRRRRRRRIRASKFNRATPRFWVRKIFQRREEYGEYHHLVQELRNEDREYFFR